MIGVIATRFAGDIESEKSPTGAAVTVRLAPAVWTGRLPLPVPVTVIAWRHERGARGRDGQGALGAAIVSGAAQPP